MMRALRTAVTAAFALMALTVASCATGAAPADLQFNPQSSRAIVVIGVEGFDQWRGMSAVLNYRGVDAAGNFDDRHFSVSNGNGWREMRPIEYFVVEVEPSAYVASGTLTHTGAVQTGTTFCLGTIRFEAPAGQAVYVGNLALPRTASSVRPRPPRMEEAVAKLQEYPGVRQTLTRATMQNVPYPASGFCERQTR